MGLVYLNNKALNILYRSLNHSMFKDIERCNTVKEIWDRLCVLHEGGTQVPACQRSVAKRKHHDFPFHSGETIESSFKRYTDI